MKDFNRYRFIAIVNLIVTIFLFIVYFIFNSNERIVYPNWISLFPGLGIFTLCIFFIFVIAAHNEKTDLQNRLKKIQKEYPKAFHKYGKVDREIEQLLNRDLSIWEQEEQQEIIRQQQRNARLAEQKRVEKDKEAIKSLEILSKAVQEGNIKLAEEQIKLGNYLQNYTSFLAYV